MDSLINTLKEGVQYTPHAKKVMFAFYRNNRQYTAVLADIRQLNIQQKRTRIDEQCIELPVYQFAYDDLTHLKNGLFFYKYVFAGVPFDVYPLKTPLEIVKDLVLSSVSWSAYKAKGATRAEHRNFKDFLSEIPIDDISSKIEEKLQCSASEAGELLNSFLSIAWKYIDGNSLEDKLLLSAVTANEELQKKVKSLIRADWETENRNLCDQLLSVTEQLSERQETLKAAQAEEARLSSLIAEKEKLAEDVEAAVSQRIQNARSNAADFIAEMAFVDGRSQQPAVIAAIPEASVKPIYKSMPLLEDSDSFEEFTSWEDAIEATAYELKEAGVAEARMFGLAAFLCAAYIEKQPILLVGPNVLDIVSAFGSIIAGHKRGVLCCDGNYDAQAIAKIGEDGEKIVVINNLFSGGWMNRIPEILSKRDIFYIVTHPYGEDIQVEPKSLYGFMLPLFTEFFVDKKPSGKYYSGRLSEDLQCCTIAGKSPAELRALAKFPLSALVKKQISSVVSTMHSACPKATADDDFMFAILPIAYATLSLNRLSEMAADTHGSLGIYPAMLVKPYAANTIFISDVFIRYAKPYAVQKILDSMR